MNNREFNLYVQLLKKTFSVPISDDLIEKDYILSLFLSNWKTCDTPNLDKLVFKGGTLLTKNFLKYHRVSEDLDFTHSDCNYIRTLDNKSQIEKQIKNRIIPIIDEVKLICDKSGLDFEVDRTNEKYIKIRNSRKLYVFSIYYKSKFVKLESFIKFEISFVEDLIYESNNLEINNIIDYHIDNLNQFKVLTNYNLQKPNLKVYSINEIILEKIRACITREQFKPRDVFDLYLINLENDVFSMDKDNIFRKLSSSPFDFSLIIPNIKRFVDLDIDFSRELEDIYNLSLIEFDEEDFISFNEKLIGYLKGVGVEFLEENKK